MCYKSSPKLSLSSSSQVTTREEEETIGGFSGVVSLHAPAMMLQGAGREGEGESVLGSIP